MLYLDSRFNPEISINSGQMFLWDKYNNSWYGTYGNYILKFSILHNKIEFYSTPNFDNWEHVIFRLDDNIQNIFSDFSNDIFLFKLLKKYTGLRLIRQDPHQCMISFACSSNTNISMIRTMLRNLCMKFGTKKEIDNKLFFTFPQIKNLYEASINELCACNVGYRAKTIKSIAEKIITKALTVDELYHSKYDDARKMLTSVYGIGNKIADCILLFSLEKTEAFPIDVWMGRAIFMYYKGLFDNGKINFMNTNKKLSYNQYSILSKIMRSHFGKYGGYAQQYLFYHIRNKENKKW
ncbi:MAG: DNA repair protein [Thaumarchaeota archaeon]|jgi:N-glycosylase/DNA lyase|nr:MAG: DNA repair protein [Nitrososphaerota archaeon]TLX88034.1 MAG: DNA repair protein [Nitrososphaerota archaeon]TLX91242.1 MAG: DNA repair protein [Nitrososphaerota archaeon]